MLGDPGTIYLKLLKLHMNKLSLFLGHSVLQKLPCLEEASSSSCKISQVSFVLSVRSDIEFGSSWSRFSEDLEIPLRGCWGQMCRLEEDANFFFFMFALLIMLVNRE